MAEKLKAVPSDCNFYIKVEPRSGMLFDAGDEERRYVREQVFRLLFDDSADGDPSEGREVGRIGLIRFLPKLARANRENIILAADEVDQDTYTYASLLYEKDGGIITTFRTYLKGLQDAAVLDYMWLEPEFRGMQFGRRFLERALHWLDPTSLALVLTPIDPECYFEDGLHRDDPYRERAATEAGRFRLARWFAAMGFGPWPLSWGDGPPLLFRFLGRHWGTPLSCVRGFSKIYHELHEKRSELRRDYMQALDGRIAKMYGDGPSGTDS